ncbi:hypothetical protein K491DRAFT_586747 [Lophiostoma macrostomum CBS 122681]|uniref:Oxidoreductase-like protein n=1 Tax=Lophiostoma macrostomum CBS 122681 TaxID=1314788 RepID=A0A6A6TSW5_9PLEO|nr:hypothetical protein K491DRAFT_586747 [Lophiostoma macrostomum CBS 122681]
MSSPPVVEARSLSTLTTLASNPPAYPRNPTHIRNEPLVLYIARVPGSRDVFLSPMKPRDKVVTAEDIQSSLYFIHFDQPEDKRLIEDNLVDNRSDFSNRPAVPQIQRKAVPDTLAPPGPPGYAGVPLPAIRKPVPGTLAPRTDFEIQQNVHAALYSQSGLGSLQPGQPHRRSFDATRSDDENQRPALPPRRSSGSPVSAGTSLTLIRRDPSSSAQWNVARIDDPPSLDVSSSSLNTPGTKKKIGAPLYIEVTNPGYSKFLNNSETPSLSSLHSFIKGPSHVSQSAEMVALRANSGPTTQVETSFRRRVWMEGSRYSNGGFGHRRNKSHDSSMGYPDSRGSFEMSSRERSSMDLRPQGMPPFLSREDQPYSTISVGDNQSSFRGYVFMSPWNGRCEFITGAGGGSLKCRHVVPGLQGAPPVAMPVSELRFNLPSSSKATTPNEETSKRSSFFHRPRNHRNHSSISEMNLSLGQEFAGGGFGGKQAKLGKLIIEDEGLKMLDLLVAANMSLWWRAYSKRDNTAG